LIGREEPHEIKTCCATFYQSDIIRLLLGELTGYLGTVVGLNAEDKVLDIACGRGASTVYLAKHFGCHVTGLDYGHDNILAAREYALNEKISHLTGFEEGDAERLLFEEGQHRRWHAFLIGTAEWE
jgi:2-polyprenyl-3-methyl-5-hydroxy-6-metoxy-1,4-benzoquinol methylase